MKEEWRNISDRYRVSSTGKIQTLGRINGTKGTEWRELKQFVHIPTKGKPSYMKVTLRINGKPKTQYVHRIVAKAFIPNADAKPEVNHIDLNKFNNSVDNLEWVTRKENMLHADKEGVSNMFKKGPLTDKETIIKACDLYHETGCFKCSAKITGTSESSIRQWIKMKA